MEEPKELYKGPEDELSKAIKTLAEPLYVDPMQRHDFDSFIVESFQR